VMGLAPGRKARYSPCIHLSPLTHSAHSAHSAHSLSSLKCHYIQCCFAFTSAHPVHLAEKPSVHI
jgi:hypothetical protein